MDRDKSIVLDIILACEAAADFCLGMSKVQFLQDRKTQSAVIHQLLIIGEAASKLSANLKEKTATIPWKQIIGMRNRLIHGYNVVDIEVVWNTLEDDISLLHNALKSVNL